MQPKPWAVHFLCFTFMKRGKLLKATPKVSIHSAKQVQVCLHAALVYRAIYIWGTLWEQSLGHAVGAESGARCGS